MDIRKSFLNMINAIEGRWDAAATHLGMSRSSLENRVYERKGQQVSTDDALQLQMLSDTKHFAEAVAARSGGVFVELPGLGEEIDNDEILGKFLDLTQHFGALARRHAEATEDGEVDAKEKADLIAIGQKIHQSVEELLAGTFHVYCRPETPPASAGKLAIPNVRSA